MVYTVHQLFYFPYHIFFLIVTTEIIQAYNNIVFTFFVVPTFNVFSKHSSHPLLLFYVMWYRFLCCFTLNEIITRHTQCSAYIYVLFHIKFSFAVENVTNLLSSHSGNLSKVTLHDSSLIYIFGKSFPYHRAKPPFFIKN